MATLTYVFYDDEEPSEKDAILWERAEDNDLTVEQIPDLYPGIAGELELCGNPKALRTLVDIAAREGLPGHPTTIRFDEHEVESVSRTFDDTGVTFERHTSS